MNIPWWTCPSCFVSHPDKTASTESGASLLQAPESRLHILGQNQNNTFKIESLLHAPDTRLFPMHPSIVARTNLFFFFCCFALSTSSPAPLPHPFLHCCQSSFSSSLPEQDQFVRFLVISDFAQIVQCTYYCPFPSILSKYHPLSFPDSASHLRCDFGTLLLVLTKMSWSLLNAR